MPIRQLDSVDVTLPFTPNTGKEERLPVTHPEPAIGHGLGCGASQIWETWGLSMTAPSSASQVILIATRGEYRFELAFISVAPGRAL